MKYVAMLRGISPSNSTMHNDKLRGVFRELGFKNVQTVISSGNVLFESSSPKIQTLEMDIENILPKRLGFTSSTIICSQAELQLLVEKNPFKGIEDTPQSRLNVTFLKNIPKIKFKFPYRVDNETYELVCMYNRAICSIINLSGSKTPDLMIWLEKQFGKEITTRTWKTVHRILKKMETINDSL
jgi:uncharacterized protein (DUF1697 family)